MPIGEWFPGLTAGEKAEMVRDAYKKHANELVALEDSQQKAVLVLLGVLAAGASFIGGQKGLTIGIGVKVGLSLVDLALIWFGMWYTCKRDAARRSVRELLVRCEEAMGFWEADVHVEGESLYQGSRATFVTAGGWLGGIKWLVVIAGLGFGMLLWVVPYPK